MPVLKKTAGYRRYTSLSLFVEISPLLAMPHMLYLSCKNPVFYFSSLSQETPMCLLTGAF